jgi:hypothetical protein
MIIEIDIDEYPQMRYAIETLEIERSRLLKSIRELRSLPATGEDFPLTRINENLASLNEIDNTIKLVRNCIEAARHARQREHPEPEKSSKRSQGRPAARKRPPSRAT